MKTIRSIILGAFLVITHQELYAGVITVNNTNPSPGQYSNLQTAVDAANAGDTLLIHRSITTYGNVIITKRLTLIGEGVMPNKISNTQTTTLGTVTLTYNSSTLEHASKSVFIGLSITTVNINEKSTDVNLACDSIQITYCRIGTLALKNNVYFLMIKQSIINSVSGGVLFNCKSIYNIFYMISVGANTGSDNLFMNNLFMIRLTFGGGVVANNIFFTPFGGAFVMHSRNVMFSNNIMYNTTATTPFNASDFSLNGNTSTNNQFNVDPLFVNPINFNSLYTYTHTSPASGPFADFHLQTGSPAIGAGTDGTDLGLYGGSTPWRDGSTTDSRYRYYPLPDAVPVVTAVTVQNPVVQEGTNLQIQLGATTTP